MTPVVFDQATARERGRAHGELWRDEIAALTEIRLKLVLQRGLCKTAEQVTAIAQAHGPVLREYLPEMHEELLGIAEGSNRSLADVILLNHFTDLRDVAPDTFGSDEDVEPPPEDPGGCTAIHCNTVRGPLLGQTWDMHASAQPFVRMIRVQPRDRDEESLCFTLTGCVGMAGIGQDGVAVTINNLTTQDTQIGVVWPALVRALIEQPSARAAKALLDRVPLTSGHHYMVGDCDEFFGIESSGIHKVVTQMGARASHLHTNHCFDPVLRKYEAISARSTTYQRLELASTLFAQYRPTRAEVLWELLCSHDGYPGSICSHIDDAAGDPDASRTCGRLVMSLWSGEMLAGYGCGQTEQGKPLALRLERFHGG